MSDTNKVIVLSAGGTGGHVMPAQALALDLRSRGYDVHMVTDNRGMKFAEKFDGIPLHEIKAGTLGAGLKGKIKGMMDLSVGILQARRILKKLKPSVVIGFGGYPSFPAVYAAQKMKIPTILHEQNAIIGKANAMLAHKATRIASSVPYLRGIDEIDRVNTVYTGNPIRPEIAALYTKPYPKFNHDVPLRILIMGGSLGATVLSKILPEALSQLPENYRARLDIVQQCRAEDMDHVRSVYAESGIKATLETFFHDAAAEIEKCHLFIGRAGASTVAEIAVSGRPAIFVPAGYHKDNQQKMNADVIADEGGAWVMTEDGFTVEAILARIETFLQNPEILFRAAEKARKCAKPDAARKLGNLVTAIESGWQDEE